VTAYLCRGFVCEAPCTNQAEFALNAGRSDA
jgi:hypothetical protein